MKRYIIANWKMNDPKPTGVRYASLLQKQKKLIRKNNIILAAPFTLLSEIAGAVKESPIAIAAQDVFEEQNGAYTGQISASLLKMTGAKYVIIGHSERRHVLEEGEKEIAEKVKIALNENLTIILCVGETLKEKTTGKTKAVLRRQLLSAFTQAPTKGKTILIAYEPVWAISTSGSGRTITPQEIQESMNDIHTIIKSVPGLKRTNKVIHIYGGSVDEINAKNIFKYSSVEGVLVGGASLDLKKFKSIIAAS